MAIWDDHGMTKEEYEQFEREYSSYLDDIGANAPPSEAAMAEMEAVMMQPSPADIEDMRQARISHCRTHLSAMPDSVGIELADFREMRDYYDSAAFLAEHGNHEHGDAKLIAQFARVADKMSFDYDPHDYRDSVDEYYETDDAMHAAQAAVIYQDLMSGDAEYIADWMDENIAYLEDRKKQADHVETTEEYAARMEMESALFGNMQFEDVLQYRVEHDMPLTDADIHLINDKIQSEYGRMQSEHAEIIDMCDHDISMADYRVEQYAADEDAQREVAACGGNVPAYMLDEYPIDEHGRPYTVAELQEQAEQVRAGAEVDFAENERAFFERVYDFHVLTTKPGVLPNNVTGNKPALSVITPTTYDCLGDGFREYHADKIQQELADAGFVSSAPVDWKGVGQKMQAEKLAVMMSDEPVVVKPQQPAGLPVVDFSKSVVHGGSVLDKTIQTQQTIVAGMDKHVRMADVALDAEDRPGREPDGYNSYKAKRDQKRDDNSARRQGLDGFEGNSVMGGRSNPDYDFDDYD